MKTYFFILKVTPTSDNPHSERVDCALAHFWVKDASEENAVIRVKHFLTEHMWYLQSWEQEPVETNAGQYPEREEGLIHYLKAQQTGFAAYFLGVSKEGWNDPGLGEWVEV